MRRQKSARRGGRTLKAMLVAVMMIVIQPQAGAAEPGDDYSRLILSDGPAAYWRLNDEPAAETVAEQEGRSNLRGELRGYVRLGEPGPRPTEDGRGHLTFTAENTAAIFDGHGSYVAIDETTDADEDADPALAFDHGDTITAEAWVNPQTMSDGEHFYIVSKGRTFNDGYPQTNQNWALRLTGDGGARLNFLFRSAGDTNDWHRWTSDVSFSPTSGWHHVAVTYTFGEPESLRGYVDGRRVAGTWDMGGPTRSGPVVDDDEVWIGASMGGSSNSFRGSIDEVAVFRHAVAPERLAARRLYKAPPPAPPAPAPDDAVLVEILEGVPDREWNFPRPTPVQQYEQPALAFFDAPRKYNNKGLIIDRSAPYMLRASTRVNLPAGEHRLLLRSLNGAKLYMDGEEIATTKFNRLGGHAHNKVEPLPTTEVEGMDDIRQIPAAHSERFVTVESDGGEHVFRLEAFIGGPRQRPDVGELTVAIANSEGRFHLLSPRSDEPTPLTDEGWHAYRDEQRALVESVNTARRAELGEAEAAYWARRHEAVREAIANDPLPDPPAVESDAAVLNDIDRYINARLEEEGVKPAERINDWEFLRRLTLDTVGVVPSPEEVRQYFDDPPDQRRQKAIDRLLDDPRWADHWVGYWQDVFAENPALINRSLNNTGAFRWYLHEAMLDNRSVDRFATEMVMMEGSTHFGGPAGFELATQNDAPYAEKAHTISQAFMGQNLSCARCHDAPFREFKQQDVFAVAAMFRRSPHPVPESSSVPGSEAELRRMIIDVTLEPGTRVEPVWPYDNVIEGDPADIPQLFARNPNDSRARLAGLITWHRNKRFAPVMANRVWRRYLGFGLIEPVDDWSDAEASHPELLAYLARELERSGYDLKHLARVIFESHTYQRAVAGEKAEPEDKFTHLFASPARRRMQAEQVVDSLYAIAGKSFDSEPLTMDAHSNRPISSMNHLGYPQRSWQMTTMANERDRPSLNLPMAMKITEVLEAFGWRGSRPDPITVREQMPTVQQAASLANSLVAVRTTGLSDDSAFTAMALQADDPEDLVRRMFVRILTREPTDDELEIFGGLLREGFADRIVSNPPEVEHTPERREIVTWRNHLSARANAIKLEIEDEIREGDPPSVRLETDWRRRAEDVVWTLVNSPEFVFVP